MLNDMEGWHHISCLHWSTSCICQCDPQRAQLGLKANKGRFPRTWSLFILSPLDHHNGSIRRASRSLFLLFGNASPHFCMFLHLILSSLLWFWQCLLLTGFCIITNVEHHILSQCQPIRLWCIRLYGLQSSSWLLFPSTRRHQHRNSSQSHLRSHPLPNCRWPFRSCIPLRSVWCRIS